MREEKLKKRIQNKMGIIRQAMLYCRNCDVSDLYNINMCIVNGERQVKGEVKCRKCGVDLNHKNKLMERKNGRKF